MPAVAVPTLCRIEILTGGEWIQRGPDVALLRPADVPPRYAAHGKVARVTELDERLAPGTVHEAEHRVCPVCDDDHVPPYDGRCLL